MKPGHFSGNAPYRLSYSYMSLFKTIDTSTLQVAFRHVAASIREPSAQRSILCGGTYPAREAARKAKTRQRRKRAPRALQRSACCSVGTSSCQGARSGEAVLRACAIGDEGDHPPAATAGTGEHVLAEDALEQLRPWDLGVWSLARMPHERYRSNSAMTNPGRLPPSVRWATSARSVFQWVRTVS